MHNELKMSIRCLHQAEKVRASTWSETHDVRGFAEKCSLLNLSSPTNELKICSYRLKKMMIHVKTSASVGFLSRPHSSSSTYFISLMYVISSGKRKCILTAMKITCGLIVLPLMFQLAFTFVSEWSRMDTLPKDSGRMCVWLQASKRCTCYKYQGLSRI